MKLSLALILVIVGLVFPDAANAIVDRTPRYSKVLKLGQYIKDVCPDAAGRYMGSADNFKHPENTLTYFLVQCNDKAYLAAGKGSGEIFALECPNGGPLHSTKESETEREANKECFEKLSEAIWGYY